jgi:hypothetical protein
MFVTNVKAEPPIKIVYVDANCANDRDLLFSSIDNIVKGQNFLIFFSRQESPLIFTNYNDFYNCFELGGDCKRNFHLTSYKDDCFYFFDEVVNYKLHNNNKLLVLTPDNLISTNIELDFFFFIDINECILNEFSALDLFVFNFLELLIDIKGPQFSSKVLFDKNKYMNLKEGQSIVMQQIEHFNSNLKISHELF